MALNWKIFGQGQAVTRCAMLVLAAFSLVGFFRLARTVANTTVAAASTALTAIYPVFFTQSSLAHVDLPAAGLIFWGLESYVRERRGLAILWFSLAGLAKETAILAPLALFLWELIRTKFMAGEGTAFSHAVKQLKTWAAARLEAVPSPSKETRIPTTLSLLVPVVPLAAWYAYHYARTGFVFGNAEFFRYNVQATVHPLRIFLALLVRMWQTFGYLNLYLLTLACLFAMRYVPLDDGGKPRTRIEIPIQVSFLAIVIAYIVALAVIGGAVLDRYMLPVVPLVILVCVSTIWRRLKLWPAMIAFVALAFVAALFLNPPYSFSPEDNLTYRDYILLHQRAENFLETRYPNARVLTAWPASDELSRPYLGYIQKPMQVVRIDDFSVEQVLSATDARSRFDVALVFSTKYEPHSIFDRWALWRRWKIQYFDYHVDLAPEAIASVLGGSLVYVEYKRGEWVGIVELQKIEEAGLISSASSR